MSKNFNNMSIELQVDLLHEMVIRGKYKDFEMHFKLILKSIRDVKKSQTKPNQQKKLDKFTCSRGLFAKEGAGEVDKL